MARRLEAWVFVVAFALALLVYTRGRYWLVDAPLLAFVGGYTAAWAARRRGREGSVAPPSGGGRGVNRSRILYYTRVARFNPREDRLLYSSEFEEDLVEGLRAGLGLDEALRLAVDGRRRRGGEDVRVG